MKQLIISAIILISFPMISKGQVIRDNNSNVRVFDTKTETASQSTNKNTLKLGLCHLINGRYILFYERQLTDLISAEGGLGFTYGNYYSMLSNNNSSSGTTIKFGPTVEGTVKFFPAKDAIFGTYFGINARYAGYNTSEGGSGSTLYNLKENQFQAMISIGHQTYDWADVFVIDYYVSLGIISGKREYLTSDANGDPYVASASLATPCVRAGLKFGFDW